MDPVSPSHPPNGGAPAAAQAGANDADPPASSPVPKTSPLLPVHQLHSPSKENIEHSIPQRLPLSRDHINTGLGTALPTEQPESQERTAATAAYIDEGSDKEARKYAMADSNSVEKGDEGTIGLFTARLHSAILSLLRLDTTALNASGRNGLVMTFGADQVPQRSLVPMVWRPTGRHCHRQGDRRRRDHGD